MLETDARPLPNLPVPAVLALAGLAAAIAAVLEPPGAAAVVLAAALLGAAARLRGGLSALALILVVSCLQNLVVASVSRWLTKPEVLALLTVKEVMAVGAGATGLWLLRHRLRGGAADVLAVLLLLWVGVRTFTGDGSLAAMAAARQAGTLPLLWICGRGLSFEPEETPRALGLVLRAGVALAVLGLLERFALGDELWVAVGLRDLYLKKGISAISSMGIPANFFSWDLGTPVRRLAGLLGEPTSMAHLLALPVALVFGARSLSGNRLTQLRVGLLPAVALALTMGKSGITTALVGIGAGLMATNRRLAALIGPALGAASVAFAGAFAASPGLRANVSYHLQSFDCGLELSLVGRGMGTAGDFAMALGHVVGRCVPSESFLAVILAQTGVVGALLYLGSCAAAALAVLRSPGLATDVRVVLAALIAGTCVTSFGSETPVGFLAGGLTFLMAGGLSSGPRIEGSRYPV